MLSPPTDIAEAAAHRSVHLPLQEIFYLIDQGFKPEVAKYDPCSWIPPPNTETDIMDTYKRYQEMVGAEEFQTLATMICFLRLTKKVCSQCGESDISLKICTKCRLTFYCSNSCQRKHWPVHKKWCKKRFGNCRDTGPAEIVLDC
jgi:hypothetical protein